MAVGITLLIIFPEHPDTQIVTGSGSDVVSRTSDPKAKRTMRTESHRTAILAACGLAVALVSAGCSNYAITGALEINVTGMPQSAVSTQLVLTDFAGNTVMRDPHFGTGVYTSQGLLFTVPAITPGALRFPCTVQSVQHPRCDRQWRWCLRYRRHQHFSDAGPPEFYLRAEHLGAGNVRHALHLRRDIGERLRERVGVQVVYEHRRWHLHARLRRQLRHFLQLTPPTPPARRSKASRPTSSASGSAAPATVAPATPAATARPTRSAALLPPGSGGKRFCQGKL